MEKGIKDSRGRIVPAPLVRQPAADLDNRQREKVDEAVQERFFFFFNYQLFRPLADFHASERNHGNKGKENENRKNAEVHTSESPDD